jgi:hypothetical protein
VQHQLLSGAVAVRRFVAGCISVVALKHVPTDDVLLLSALPFVLRAAAYCVIIDAPIPAIDATTLVVAELRCQVGGAAVMAVVPTGSTVLPFALAFLRAISLRCCWPAPFRSRRSCCLRRCHSRGCCWTRHGGCWFRLHLRRAEPALPSKLLLLPACRNAGPARAAFVRRTLEVQDRGLTRPNEAQDPVAGAWVCLAHCNHLRHARARCRHDVPNAKVLRPLPPLQDLHCCLKSGS